MNPIQLPSIVLGSPLIFILLNGCFVSKEMNTASIPAVKSFDLQRFLGTWYEVARLPHSFENGLDKVTATYTLRDDGKIDVLNRGFNTVKGEWKEAKGKARFKDPSTGTLLEVSFFWIFYSDYKVIILDTMNYSYAMVTSSSKKYLWILSRTPHLSDAISDTLIRKAGDWGFNISAIYKVPQE
ncbi:MAG: lipocalin family protein [Ignavibacteriales bacterium]|nr:lipocalin family protein [Ignavibacteriales bacterium]